MEKVLKLKECTFTAEDDNMYQYFLAVSSDKLLVLSKIKDNDYKLVEEIVSGKDTNGTLCSCADEDSFLDAIIVIKDMLLRGLNPLEHLIL